MTPVSLSWTKTRERGGGLLFALALNALLLLALLTLAPRPEPRVDDPRHPVSFTLAPAQQAEKAKAHKSKARKRRVEKAAEQRQAPPAVRPPRPVVRPAKDASLPFLVIDSAQMASADIGRMPAKDAGQGTSGQGQGQGQSAAAAGPGEGPGGVQLFEAEWYRRPSPAELSTYIPADAPASGWGLVACKTVDDFHVENCQALGESPVGSGFARAVRLAAWQFLVRPPRVNGKLMVGSWVRIRIDYSRSSSVAG
ncbi:hypothetical protein [Sphingobium mellinum]|uniref:hypothetical protein n=1 Tax=Sphingobium mellinum TaxID=1387166 RepID=UPI0030ECE50D